VAYMAGVTTLSNLASAMGVRTEEAAVVAELKAGSEAAFEWLIAQYTQPVYSLLYRMLDDPADVSDTTQEVFIKVFRGIKRFNSDSSLKTWIYRIALHEAFNQRRWHFRHKQKETSIEPPVQSGDEYALGIKDLLVDESKSPLDNIYDEELKARVEQELRSLPEPYRTTVILRDIEELSYEQIADVMSTSLGTVKSRLVRGRDALRKRLERHMPAFGVSCSTRRRKLPKQSAVGGQEAEVLP
jgi:RNA polymerase sigma-70 factor (ECF subfamily)